MPATIQSYRRAGGLRFLAILSLAILAVALGSLHSRTGYAQTFSAAEKVFRPQANVLGPHLLEIAIGIEPGNYLYKNKLKFEIEPAGIQLQTLTLPSGVFKEDPVFGRTEIYREGLRFQLPIHRPDARVRDLRLSLSYQGCSDQGLCYPPQVKKIALRLPAGDLEAVSPSRTTGTDNSSAIHRLLAQRSTVWVLLSFFGFGLLLSLTPCVFPMIPILSGIIVSQGSTINKKRGLALSAAYVLGMAVTYALAGILAGLSGSLLAAFLQNPWVIGGFALIFVLLALSMFGLYELQLPGRLQSRLTQASNRLSGGRLLAVFFMGALSALIIGPCVTAPLAGALLYISRTQNIVLGGSALFSLALGMGIPLLVIGTSAGVLIPKAGPWMETVKKGFGVLLLAVALWLFSPFLPLPVQMFLGGSLLVVVSVFLGALDPLPVGTGAGARLGKGLGVILLLLGGIYLVGAFTGPRDLHHPLSGLTGNPPGETPDQPREGVLSFQPITGSADLDQALRVSLGRPVLLYFGAEWCTSCKTLERSVFQDRQVREKIKKFQLLKVDLTDNLPGTQALLKKFSLFGPPAVLLFDTEGREVSAARMVGEFSALSFLNRLNQVP